VILKPGLGVTQSHWKWYHWIRHPWLPINVHSNHRPISYRFRDKKLSWCWQTRTTHLEVKVTKQ